MSFWDIVVLSAGLSMDALAASVCKGLSLKRVSIQSMVTVGAFFGFFQGAMPLACYLVLKFISNGLMTSETVKNFTPWAAFVLLLIIGINMIHESRNSNGIKSDTRPLAFTSMLSISFATSIDAFATGLTFLYMDLFRVVCVTSLIALTTFVFCSAGVRIGAVFGAKLKSKAELAGGIVLVSLGLKFLLKDALSLF